MADPSSATSTPATALASFDSARDAFLAAFAGVPDEALSYVPPGDEYALGVLLIHLQDPIHHYLEVFDLARGAVFGVVDLGNGPEGAARARADKERYAFLAAQRPSGAQRAGMLADLARAHQLVYERMAPLNDTTFARQVPVIYSADAAPFPTSARDIMGWLIDHYQEHVDQTRSILAQWQARV
jgi:hypothetical protein